MVSLDSADRNGEFSTAHGDGFPVVSDPTGETARAYGVVAEDGRYARRFTFYIDRDGVIRYVDREVDPRTAGRDVARRLEKLGFPKR